MANNKLELVNKITGKRAYIGKYYPSTGWYIPETTQDIAKSIQDVFDFSDNSQWGKPAFELVYETDDEPL